jgi:hypothetical protein
MHVVDTLNRERQPLQLDAIVNTVCLRCGRHGHIKADCWNDQNAGYDLIGEDDVAYAQAASAQRHAEETARDRQLKRALKAVTKAAKKERKAQRLFMSCVLPVSCVFESLFD